MVPTGPAATRVLALAADHGGLTRGLRSSTRASYAGMLVAVACVAVPGTGLNADTDPGSWADIDPKGRCAAQPGTLTDGRARGRGVLTLSYRSPEGVVVEITFEEAGIASVKSLYAKTHKPTGRELDREVQVAAALHQTAVNGSMDTSAAPAPSPPRRPNPEKRQGRLAGSDPTDPQRAVVKSEQSACCVRHYSSSTTIASVRPRKKSTSRLPSCGRCSWARQQST